MSCIGGVGYVGVGWGGVGHVGVGWSVSCIGGVGWGGSCRGGVGHVGMGWGVNNFICHKLGVLSFSSDKLLSTAFWIMWEKACFCL